MNTPGTLVKSNSSVDDENKIPPTLEDCRKYLRATSTGKVVKKGQKCPYSKMYIDNEEFDIFCKVEEFAELGPGYAIYFDLLKVMIMVLLILGAPALNLVCLHFQGNDCLKRDGIDAPLLLNTSTVGAIKNDSTRNRTTTTNLGNPNVWINAEDGTPTSGGSSLIPPVSGVTGSADHGLGVSQRQTTKSHKKRERYPDEAKDPKKDGRDSKGVKNDAKPVKDGKKGSKDPKKSTQKSSTPAASSGGRRGPRRRRRRRNKPKKNQTIPHTWKPRKSTLKNLQRSVSYYCHFNWYNFDDKQCQRYMKLKCLDHQDVQECKDLTLTIFNHAGRNWACLRTFNNRASFANWGDFRNDNTVESSIFNSFIISANEFLAMIILAIAAFYLNFQNGLQSKVYNSEILTVRQFSVQLRGLPTSDDLMKEHQITDQIQALVESTGAKVTEINLVYETKPYELAKRKFEVLRVKKLKQDWLEESKKTGELNHLTKKEREALFKANHPVDGMKEHFKAILHAAEMKKYEHEFSQGSTKNLHGKAFVSFETYEQAERFLRERRRYSKFKTYFNLGEAPHRKGDLKLDMEGKIFKIFAKEAREPEDIIWENQNVSRKEKIIMWILYTLFEIFIILMAFVTVSFIDLIFDTIVELLNSRSDQNFIQAGIENLIGLIDGGIILFIDYLFELIVEHVVEYTRPRTQTEKHTRIATTLWKLQFLNDAFAPLLFCAGDLNFFGREGLVEEMNSVFVASLYMPIFMETIFNPDIVHREAEIIKLNRFIKKRKGTRIYTQKEANEIYSKMHFEISIYYAHMMKTFMVAVFYLPMIPMSIFYATVSLFVWYWFTKYMLIKQSNKIWKYGEEISKALIPEFKWALLILVAGAHLQNFVIKFMNHKDITFTPFLILSPIIAILFLFVDLDLVTKPLLPEIQQREEGKTYEEMMKQRSFKKYVETNPAFESIEEVFGGHVRDEEDGEKLVNKNAQGAKNNNVFAFAGLEKALERFVKGDLTSQKNSARNRGEEGAEGAEEGVEINLDDRESESGSKGGRGGDSGEDGNGGSGGGIGGIGELLKRIETFKKEAAATGGDGGGVGGDQQRLESSALLGEENTKFTSVDVKLE